MEKGGVNMLQTQHSTLNIGVFGDSIGKGIVLRPNSDRYSTLKVNVHDVIGTDESKVNIENYSMMGSTITKGINIIERHFEKIKNYSSVLLEFGGNDCDYNWKEISENPQGNFECNTPLQQFNAKYKTLVELIRKENSHPVMISLPPLVPDKYFEWISRNLNKDNILKWLNGDVNTIYRWQELYNSQVTLLASQLKVPLIDIRSAFLLQSDYTQFICDDGIHPNEKGYNLIYKTIKEQYKLNILRT